MDQPDIARLRRLALAVGGDGAREQFVVQLYREMLGRDGEAAGIAAHVRAMRGGAIPADIVAAFLASREYRILSQRRAQVADGREAAHLAGGEPIVLPLSRWHARSWAAPRRIAFVGDSTTAQMDQGPIAAWAEAYLTTTGELPNTTFRMFGASGNTLYEFMQDTPGGAGLADVVDYAPDLILFCYGINDVRFGQSSLEGLTSLVDAAVETFRHALPSRDIILRMPNPLLTTGENIAWPRTSSAAAAAQHYSDMLRDAYRAAAKAHPEIALYDTRGRFFADVCAAEGRYMHDDIHPTGAFHTALLEDLTRTYIGRSARLAVAE